MSFNAKVVFTGLCAYVPNEKLNDPLYKPSKMTILMPNAGVNSRFSTALDGRELRRHYPVLKFNSNALEVRGSMPEGVEVQWHLQGMEVTFYIENVEGNEFVVYQDLNYDDQERRHELDFNWGVSLVEVAPSFSHINPEVFGYDEAASRLVSSRIVIDHGKLSTHLLDQNVRWRFDRALGSTFNPRYLSNAVALDFVSIPRLIVRARPFGVDKVVELSLVNSSGNLLELEIGNLCEECLFSYDESDIDLDEIERDRDFRWFYELSRDAANIPGELVRQDRVSLPIPIPFDVEQGSGSRTVECMRATFAEYKEDKAVENCPKETTNE